MNQKAKLKENLKQYISKNGLEESIDVRLTSKQMLEALDSSKDVLGQLYYDFSHGEGFLRKLKNLFIKRISSISRNTVERSMIRQQKFNDNTARLLRVLAEENQELKSRISQLTSKNVSKKD